MKTLLATSFLLALSLNAIAEQSNATVSAPMPQGGQAVAVKSNEGAAAVKKDPVNDFDLVAEVKSREPTPEEITQIKTIWEGMRRAQEKPAGNQPRPVISVTNVDLSPGSTPPLVRLSNSTGAILMFMDVNGKRWPVDHVSNLSENEIESQDKPADASKEQSSVFVKAKKFGAAGNLAIFLKGMDTPIIITFLAGQKDVDYRVDFRVPFSVDGSSSSGAERQEFDGRLSSALMGISPQGCLKSSSSVQDVLAWNCTKDTIIRSSGVLLSPATIDGKKASGADGTHAYIIPTTPVVSMMIGGKIKTVKIGVTQ